MGTKHIKVRIASALCLVAGTLLLVLAGLFLARQERADRFDKALDDTKHNGQRIEMLLSNAVNVTETLGAEMRSLEANGLVGQEAQAILAQYYSVYGGSLTSIQYAPRGYVEFICPEEGNEAAHINLFETEGRKEDATFSRDTGHTLINGPFDLVQGGRGFVINNPVYFDESAAKGGATGSDASVADNFMGFTTVLLDATNLVENPSVLSLGQEGYHYLILKEELHPERGTTDPYVVSTHGLDATADLSNTASYAFEIEGYRFSVYAVPISGWINLPRDLALFTVMETIVVLVSVLLDALLRIREKSTLLKRLSVTDHLTGLYNRTALREQFPTMVGHEITVVMLDIDYFKTYNDTYGHEMGDKVLRAIAEVMHRYSSETFTVFRFGGDEFLIWDTGRDEQAAIRRVEALIADVDTIKIRGCDFPVHMSYGACHGTPTTDDELRELRYVADERLYEVKAARPPRER